MSYDGEVCEDCGFPVAHFVSSWWQADNDLWNRVYGSEGGILCPPCFERRCRAKGIYIFFRAEEAL